MSFTSFTVYHFWITLEPNTMYTWLPVGFLKPMTDPLDERYIYTDSWMVDFYVFLLMYRWLCHNYMDPMGSSFLGIYINKSLIVFLCPIYVVVSHMFHFHPEYWGRFPIWLAHIFQVGWWKTHQPARGEAHPTENPGRHEPPKKENKILQGRERLRTFFSSMLGPRFMGI